MTREQLHVLKTLIAVGKVQMADLAMRCQMKKGLVRAIVRKLEREDLVVHEHEHIRASVLGQIEVQRRS